MIPKALKKYIFLGLLSLSVFLFYYVLLPSASGVLLALVLWLLLENKYRKRFRFLAGNSSGAGFSEWNQHLDQGEKIASVVFAPDSNSFALVTEQGALHLLDINGKEKWCVRLGKAPQAFLPRPQGAGAWIAEDARLVMLDADGKEEASQVFEAPEFLQAYSLHCGEKEGSLFLKTPWFVQAFDRELQSAGPRLNSDTVGNYIKYIAVAPKGESVFLGGALLLEKDEGIQARWSKWDLNLEKKQFTLAWQKEDEGSANSHLRGLQWPSESLSLLAERYRDGYDILLYDSQGGERWNRGGGEHPRLSRDAQWLLWENPFEGVTLTSVADKKKVWVHKAEEKIRLKRPLNKGETLILEGRQLRWLAVDGSTVAEDWFYTDPFLLEEAPNHRALFVARQGHFGLIQMETEQ